MEKTNQKTAEPVKIYSAPDAISGEMIRNLLHNEGIECYKKELETGNFMNIYMGYSVFGEEIYVNSVDEKAAREILKVLEPENQEDGGDLTEEDLYERVPFYKNRRIIVWIFLSFLGGGTLLLYVLTYLVNQGYF